MLKPKSKDLNHMPRYVSGSLYYGIGLGFYYVKISYSDYSIFTKPNKTYRWG